MSLFDVHFGKRELASCLAVTDELESEAIRSKAYEIKIREVGAKVYFRGLVELSNVCQKDCFYCGIRKSNHGVRRYTMTKQSIMESARFAFDSGYGSIAIQGGERADEGFIRMIEEVLEEIREQTEGKLGITLSLGEQRKDTYRRWFERGAHRYLLRLETSNPGLYRALHPADHSFEERLRCLDDLRAIGYQVGTGVMIGLPGQSHEDLADDLLFFERLGVDMVGMGPFIPHHATPLGASFDDTPENRRERLMLSLRMISLARILMKDINIVAATALQAIDPRGRELALLAGANIVMPIITQAEYRKEYMLYDGKPCLEDTAVQCRECLETRIRSCGESVGYNQWGDAPRARKRVRTVDL